MRKAIHGTTTLSASSRLIRKKKQSSKPIHAVGDPSPSHGGGGDDGPPADPPYGAEQSGNQVFQVQLNAGTIAKLAVPAVIAILGVAATLVVFYFSTKAHLKDQHIHLEPKERDKLETRTAAKRRTKRVIKILRRESKLTRREISVQQREQINAATKKLEKMQDQHYRRIINEVRGTRRDIRRQH
jgi:uncharacterized protein HemX